MRGAIPPLRNTRSWRGAQFRKTQEQRYLLQLKWDSVEVRGPRFTNFAQTL
jgi:hypothetical protein